MSTVFLGEAMMSYCGLQTTMLRFDFIYFAQPLGTKRFGSWKSYPSRYEIVDFSNRLVRSIEAIEIGGDRNVALCLEFHAIWKCCLLRVIGGGMLNEVRATVDG
jgi:hypothetical protein